MFDTSSRSVASIRPIGNTALLAAALTVIIQLFSANPTEEVPILIAVMLCVVGQGMRIEATIKEQRPDM